MTSAFTLVIF
jgi:hypothetical protein